MLAVLSILIAGLGAYGQVVSFAFVRWDDPSLITENPLIQNFSPRIFTTFDPELYIPLTLLTFQLEHLLFGFHPFVFHLDNLLLHLANSLLVFALLHRIVGRKHWAWAGAVLFAVHPLQSEAVSWVSARKDLLMSFWFLLSVLSWLRFEAQREKSLFWLSVGLFLLSILSKPTAIVLPPLITLWGLLHGERLSPLLKRTWPHWVLAIAFAIVAVFGKQEAAASLPAWNIFLLALQNTATTLQHVFLPLHLSAIYPGPADYFSVRALVGGSAIVLLLWTGWRLRRSIPSALFGAGWFLLTLAPAFLAYRKSGDITLTADRYAYLPLVGLLLFLASIGSHYLPRGTRERLILAVTLLIALPSILLARQQSQVWRDTQSLFANVLRHFPTSHVALNNIGFLHLQKNDLPSAEAYFQRALAEKPQYPDAEVNLGVVYAKQGKLDEAEALFRQALRQEPTNAQATFNLAGIAFTKGNYPEAIRLYEETLRLRPGYRPAERQLEEAGERLAESE